MPKLIYTEQNLPHREELRRQLAEAIRHSNPLDELLELSDRLHDIERSQGTSSAEFYAQYRRGERGDDEQTIQWAMLYQTYLELKRGLESALFRQAVWVEQPITAT